MPTIRRSVKAYPFLKYCNCMYLSLIDRSQVIVTWFNQWNASLQSISAVYQISFIFHLCSTDHPEPSRPVSLQVNKLPVQCTNKPCMSCTHAYARSPSPHHDIPAAFNELGNSGQRIIMNCAQNLISWRLYCVVCDRPSVCGHVFSCAETVLCWLQ